MFLKETQAVLHKSLPELPQLVSARSLKHDSDDLVAMALPNLTLAVIDDRHTAEACGSQVFRALKGRFSAIHITLEGAPVADQERMDYIRRAAAPCNGLVAVGSGTINDLC